MGMFRLARRNLRSLPAASSRDIDESRTGSCGWDDLSVALSTKISSLKSMSAPFLLETPRRTDDLNDKSEKNTVHSFTFVFDSNFQTLSIKRKESKERKKVLYTCSLIKQCIRS